MREDYGNISLVPNDDGFGDMGFDTDAPDLMRHASGLEPSMEQVSATSFKKLTKNLFKVLSTTSTHLKSIKFKSSKGSNSIIFPLLLGIPCILFLTFIVFCPICSIILSLKIQTNFRFYNYT